jgi:nucleoside-diphosphate-sugar epimerase
MVMRQQNTVVGKGEGVSSFVHIHDAAIATAALLAAEPEVYNLMDDDSSPQSVWLPAFAKSVGDPVPPPMSQAGAAAIAGEDAVYYATKLNGASNAKAKRILGWKPRRLEWLEARVTAGNERPAIARDDDTRRPRNPIFRSSGRSTFHLHLVCQTACQSVDLTK